MSLILINNTFIYPGFILKVLPIKCILAPFGGAIINP